MNALRAVLGLGCWICGCANLVAGTVNLPSDVSVSLMAEPSVNLQSGQRITFTMSATNHGPEPVDRLPLASSPIYDELDVFSNASSDCDGDIVLVVVDLEDSFYFFYAWFPVSAELPLAMGETRTCDLSLDFTSSAPSIFPVTFEFPDFLFDLDESNNSATVFLRRPVAVVAPVPTLSPTWLGLLVCLLVAAAGVWRTQSRTRSRLFARYRYD